MNYTGKLYGKIGGVYFDTGKTSEDYDYLDKKVKEFERQDKDPLDNIITQVCKAANISRNMFFSKTNKRVVVRVRAAYIKIAKLQTDLSLDVIGNKIDRDYTTIIYHNKFEHPDVMKIVNQII